MTTRTAAAPAGRGTSSRTWGRSTTDARKPRPGAPGVRNRLTAGRLVIHGLLALCSIAFLAPLLMVLSASFSSESAINRQGYSLLPRHFTTFAYRYIAGDPTQLIQAYGVSILVTVSGTLVSLLVMSMLAFTLARRDYPLRRPLTLYLIFAMLFNGGLVPTYILITQYLHLQNTLFVLVLPYLASPWFIILLRTYFASLPSEILDAARIDGAGELRTFFQVVLPLSTPALATVGLFTGLIYWNDWWLGLLYMDNGHLAPVQLFLYRIISNIDYAASTPQAGQLVTAPVQTVRMAVAVLAIGPIVIAFGFIQRYLVRGIAIGGLKG